MVKIPFGIKEKEKDVKCIRPQDLGWLEKKLSNQEMDYLWRCIKNKKEDCKNKLGSIVNVSSIGSSSTGIGNYVDDYYHDNGLTYLLLVGDIAQMPSPNLSGSLSDPSYGFIDGNDSYAEILVGRFSGNNPSQIETQVERSIEYELDPQGGASWYDNALGVASHQGPGFGGMMDDEFN